MELVQLIVQTKWNSRKQWETVGNSRKHDQDKTCPTRIFFKINISAPRRFFFKVQKCHTPTKWDKFLMVKTSVEIAAGMRQKVRIKFKH